MSFFAGRSRRERHARRSWFSQAVLASMTVDRGPHDCPCVARWQCAPAPALVRLAGRRRGNGSLFASLSGVVALAMLGLLVLWPDALCAQEGCTEGRTASGQCVNAAPAHNVRQMAVVFSQLKISQTALLAPLSADAN